MLTGGAAVQRKFYLRILLALIFCAGLGPLAFGAVSLIRGIDVLRQAKSDGEGVAVLSESVATMRSHAETLKISPRANKTYHYVSKVIKEIDLMDVFASEIPYTVSPREKLFSVLGTRQAEEYLIDSPNLPFHAQEKLLPFEFASEVRVLHNDNPIPGEKLGFGLKAKAWLHTGDIGHQEIRRLWSGLHQFLSPDNLAALSQESDPNAAVLREFEAVFPETYRFLTRYFQIEPKISFIEQSDGRLLSLFKSTFVVRIERIEADFPQLGKYLDRLMSIHAEGSMVFHTSPGVQLASFDFVTSTRTFSLEYASRDGAIIPRDARGLYLWSQAIDLGRLKAARLSSTGKLKGKVLGLEMSVADVEFAHQFKDSGEVLLESRLLKLPTPVIKGRLLGIFSGSFVDFLIPGSIDEYAQKFSEGLLQANGGEGTFARLTYFPEYKGNRCRGEFGTEVVDNFFLGFGLKVAQSYIWPSPAVVGESWNMSVVQIKSLDQDLKQLLIVR